jgi:hypothetical protein
MPKGGVRKGAGRPKGSTKLSFMKCLQVGMDCEQAWLELLQIGINNALREITNNVSKEWAKAKNIPKDKREKWLESEEGQNYFDDIIFALQTDQNIDDEEDPVRVLQINPKRPKGHRKRIMKDVSQRYSISERMVETCWKKYRSFEKSDLQEK